MTQVCRPILFDMGISFTKYHGSGNDFILIDDRNRQFAVDSALIKQLCHRHFGIGADGLILLQPSQCSHAMMRVFNADGKEASMCGNGLRCAAHFLSGLMGSQPKMILTSLKKHHHCHVTGSRVTATLGAPKNVRTDLKISIEDTALSCCYLDTGVPHLVIFVDDLTHIFRYAKALRHHPQFAPEGVNVNFAQRLDHHTWKIRTYERGVEAETLACGTGAAAVAVAAWYHDPTSTHFAIHCLSKEILQFDVFPTNALLPENRVSLEKLRNANRKKLDHQLLNEIQMTGSVCPVFQGRVSMKPPTDHERFSFHS